MHKKTRRNCKFNPHHLRWRLVGIFASNTSRTLLVLTRMQEMQRTKLIPKAGWRRRHVQSRGSPMKIRELEKQQMSENKRRKDSSRFVAFTIGVLRNLTNTPMTKTVRKTPNTANIAKAIPKGSVQDRNSMSFRKHEVWFSLDQELLGHLEQMLASVDRKSWSYCIIIITGVQFLPSK